MSENLEHKQLEVDSVEVVSEDVDSNDVVGVCNEVSLRTKLVLLAPAVGLVIADLFLNLVEQDVNLIPASFMMYFVLLDMRKDIDDFVLAFKKLYSGNMDFNDFMRVLVSSYFFLFPSLVLGYSSFISRNGAYSVPLLLLVMNHLFTRFLKNDEFKGELLKILRDMFVTFSSLNNNMTIGYKAIGIADEEKVGGLTELKTQGSLTEYKTQGGVSEVFVSEGEDEEVLLDFETSKNVQEVSEEVSAVVFSN